MLTLKRQRLSVKLWDLFILDDSDDLSGAEGVFGLEVKRGSQPAVVQAFSFDYADTGESVPVNNNILIEMGPDKIDSLLGASVSVALKAEEDDSDSPLDDNDFAHADFGVLEMPWGPGEQITNQILSLDRDYQAIG